MHVRGCLRMENQIFYLTSVMSVSVIEKRNTYQLFRCSSSAWAIQAAPCPHGRGVVLRWGAGSYPEASEPLLECSGQSRLFHRTTEWLRREGTCGGHLGQPQIKQGPPEQGARDPVQATFEDLQGGDSTASLCSLSHLHLCQCSVTCTVKKCFLMFRQNLLCSNSWPLPLVLTQDTTEW